MKPTKEEIYGFAGSSIFCLLVLFLLYVTVIKTTIVSGEEGILVNFGNVDLAAGTFELRRGEPQSQTVRQPVQQQTPRPETPPSVSPQRTVPRNNAPVITQDRENTAAVEAARKEQEEKNRIEAEQREQREREQEEQRRLDAINRQVSGAFGSNASGRNQGGTGTTGSGVQGNPNSTSSAGSPSGTGYGEFNLGGRTLGAGGLPRPDYSAQEEGRIVIDITVDPDGNVIRAEIGRGTNIDNINLRRSALDAARKAKFNRINGNNNQTGTITYRYTLR